MAVRIGDANHLLQATSSRDDLSLRFGGPIAATDFVYGTICLIGYKSIMSPVRRLIYASRPSKGTIRSDVESILWTSKRNNGMDGLSGVLWHTEHRYLQVLEGAPDAVEDTFGRILNDDRHWDVRILSDEEADAREFGDWTMGSLPGDIPGHAAERIRGLICNKDAEITRHFFTPETELDAG